MSSGGLLLDFLSFAFAVCFTCQSATAAAQITHSTSSSSAQACFICCAVSTLIRRTSNGASRDTGPEMRHTSAPCSAQAEAMA